MSVLVSGILAGGGGGGSGGGIAEAPSDGKVYGRKNAGWAAVESARYLHVQGSASASWSVQHNLGSKPVAVWTFRTDGSLIFGEPDYAGATANLLTINFCEPVSGSAYVFTLL